MKQSGFTLLEMLIAFVLVSLLFVSLFGAFHTLARSWDAADTRMNKTDDMRLITDFLRRQLSQAMVVRIKTKKGDPAYAFAGTTEAVRYVAPLQPLQHQGGIFLIELSIARSKQSQALTMLFAPYRPDLTWEEAFKDAEPVTVFDGLKEAAFDYFGTEDAGKKPAWQKQWPDIPKYPQLLRLRLADQERAWPELVVTLPQVNDNGG